MWPIVSSQVPGAMTHPKREGVSECCLTPDVISLIHKSNENDRRRLLAEGKMNECR